jgi:hypothetical protein
MVSGALNLAVGGVLVPITDVQFALNPLAVAVPVEFHNK